MTAYEVLKRRLILERGGQCVACDCREWEILTWHHVGKKRFEVSQALYRYVNGKKDAEPLPLIEAEIAKCVLLCPTCHALVNKALLLVRLDGWCFRVTDKNGRHASACANAHAPELAAA